MSRFLRHPPALLGLGLLILLSLGAVLAGPAEHWLGADAETLDLASMLLPPSLSHPLGTDELGRDMLARLMRGGQVSLLVGLLTAAAAAIVGTTVGLLAGSRGGLADAVLMRLTDGVIALPLLPLLIVLGALDPTKLGLPPEMFRSETAGLVRIVIIIALVGWTTVARLVRSATLSLKQQDFIRAAQALGVPPGRLMLRHLLPNVASPVIVATSLSVGNIILLESALSFLGLGVQPPMASWGNMLTGALQQLFTAPMLAVWPGGLIFLTVLAFNLLGDGLQEALDPRGRS